MQDPQAASKVLVDHALARFSTDNLSCMVIRLDGPAVQNRVDHRTEPMGVEGDPGTNQGKLSEADALVLQAKKRVSLSKNDEMEHVSAEKVIKQTQGEPGPELKPGEGISSHEN